MEWILENKPGKNKIYLIQPRIFFFYSRNIIFPVRSNINIDTVSNFYQKRKFLEENPKWMDGNSKYFNLLLKLNFYRIKTYPLSSISCTLELRLLNAKHDFTLIPYIPETQRKDRWVRVTGVGGGERAASSRVYARSLIPIKTQRG